MKTWESFCLVIFCVCVLFRSLYIFLITIEILFNGTWDISVVLSMVVLVHDIVVLAEIWEWVSIAKKKSNKHKQSDECKQTLKFSQLICKGKQRQTVYILTSWFRFDLLYTVVCTRFSCNGFSNALTFSSTPKQRWMMWLNCWLVYDLSDSLNSHVSYPIWLYLQWCPIFPDCINWFGSAISQS